MRRAHIAILSIADDLHALAIQDALRACDDVTCSIVETNRLSGGDTLSWSLDGTPATVPASDGSPLNVRELDLIWWRRIDFPQQTPTPLTEPAHIDLVNNDCDATIIGTLLTEFGGTWISDPAATRRAENKLVQLRAARQAGLHVPDTLVSQSPEQVRAFCARYDNQVIIKPVRGTRLAPVYTRVVTDEILASDDAMRLCPAIYQECIAGARHLRVLCFGEETHAAMIESDDLDWRGNLDIPFSVVDLEPGLAARLREVLRLLGLQMGAFDLKLDQNGEPVWIEVNPQGQFLFVEGITGLDLTHPFAAFLRREALASAEGRG
jgi:glutathione synthase/RimK-type ligase-like ATP-grasp enzyme